MDGAEMQKYAREPALRMTGGFGGKPRAKRAAFVLGVVRVGEAAVAEARRQMVPKAAMNFMV